ncbi:MAG: aldo/keto reductase [Clostridia bacterium]
MQKVMMAGLEVSRMCFGTLTMGPLQKGMTVEEGAELLVYAFSKGVNFFDTAELYGTYPYMAEAIRRIRSESGAAFAGLGDPVISTKSYAYDIEGARNAVERARRELDIDVIDIMMLHEQETKLTMEGHREALEFYLEQKARGVIRAVGVSTHAIEVVKACAQMPEIDVIHPIVNYLGVGIIDAKSNTPRAEQMREAVALAQNAGKGVFAMKPLGGGNLAKTYEDCMKYVLGNEHIQSIAVGMQTQDEIDMNIAVFDGTPVSDELRARCVRDRRSLHVADWCQGCGNCIKSCQFKALRIATRGNSKDVPLGHVTVDQKRCTTCGYCSRRCPVFALKIY